MGGPEKMSSFDNNAIDRAVLEHLLILLSRLTRYDNELSEVVGKLEQVVDRLLGKHLEAIAERKAEAEVETIRKMTVEEDLETMTYDVIDRHKSLRFVRRRRVK
jgi:hypothetical protein